MGPGRPTSPRRSRPAGAAYLMSGPPQRNQTSNLKTQVNPSFTNPGKVVLKEAKSQQTVAAMRENLAKSLGMDLMQMRFLPDLEMLEEQQKVEKIKLAAQRDREADAEFDNLRNDLMQQLAANLTTASQIRKQKWILRYNNQKLLAWDTFIMFLALVNSVFIPIEISLEPEQLKVSWYTLLTLFIDFFFVIDIVVAFRTSYLTPKGKEVFDSKKIAMRYLMGQFVIDLLPVMQLHYLADTFTSTTNARYFKMLGLFKLIRLLRIQKVIQNLAVTEETKAMLKIMQLTLFLFVYIHLVGCLWFYIIDWEDVWIPPLDFIDAQTKIYDEESKKILYQYAMSFYHSVLMLGGNELGPVTPAECLFVAVAMVAAAIIQAQIFGEMAVLLTIIDRDSAEFQEKVDTANTAMSNINLTSNLQMKVRDYFIFTQATLAAQQELEKFLELLSPDLVQKIQHFIFFDVLSKNKTVTFMIEGEFQIKDHNDFDRQASGMSNLSRKSINKKGKSKEKEKGMLISGSAYEFTQKLVQKLETMLCEPEDRIVKQDEETTDMFVIAKGKCTVTQKNHKKEEKRLKVLGEGEQFGEISMIYRCPRTCSVYSQNYNTIAVLKRVKYKEIVQQYPAYPDYVKQVILEYRDPFRQLITDALSKIDYFQNIPEQILQEVIYNLKFRRFRKGEVLFHVGDAASSLFVVTEGQIELYTYLEGHEFILEKLSRGSILNHRAFFMEDDMLVHVKFSKKTVLLELTQDKFDKIIAKNEVFERKIQYYENELLKRKKTFPLDYIMNLPQEYRDDAVSEQEQEGVWRRENIFKNVVMRRILEIRNERRKPRLESFVKQLKLASGKPKIKQILRQKFLMLYDPKHKKKDESDEKYDRLAAIFNRMSQIVDTQHNCLYTLEKKMSVMQRRKEERSRNPDLMAKIQRAIERKTKQKQIEEFRAEAAAAISEASADDEERKSSSEDELEKKFMKRAIKHRADEVFKPFKIEK